MQLSWSRQHLVGAGGKLMAVDADDIRPTTCPPPVVGVLQGLSATGWAALITHGLEHAVTHDAMTGQPRDVREVVAESVAYAVCSRSGLDLPLRSVAYVACWMAPAVS